MLRFRISMSLDGALAGGAKAAQQYLAAGLVDEVDIHLVPTLPGSGERLFEGVGYNLHGLQLVRTVATPTVTHLKFTKPWHQARVCQLVKPPVPGL